MVCSRVEYVRYAVYVYHLEYVVYVEDVVYVEGVVYVVYEQYIVYLFFMHLALCGIFARNNLTHLTHNGLLFHSCHIFTHPRSCVKCVKICSA